MGVGSASQRGLGVASLAASSRWSPASKGARRGCGFLIWKGGAMVLTPWDCAKAGILITAEAVAAGRGPGDRSRRLCRRLPLGSPG